MAWPKVHIGDCFHSLQVLRKGQFTEPKGRRRSGAECECLCGATLWVRLEHLLGNHTKSCGHDRHPAPGNVYGSLTVLREHKRGWWCRCECGSEVYRLEKYLHRDGRRDCGKHKTPPKMRGRFGRLCVMGKAGWKYHATGKNRLIRCICDCGMVTDVLYGGLLSGDTESCGCKRRELAAGIQSRREGRGPVATQKEAADAGTVCRAAFVGGWPGVALESQRASARKKRERKTV